MAPSTFLVDLARVARHAGIEMTVVSMMPLGDHRYPRELAARGIDVRSLDLASRWDPRGPGRALGVVTELGPQVIHSHLKHADLLAAHVAPRLQIPMVSTLHLVEGAPGTVGAFKRDIAVRARRRAARTIAVSDAVRRWYLDLTAADPQTVVTVYNGVPAPVFSDGQREAVRLALDVPDDAVLVAMVAIMRPGKGHDVLLEAASRLPAGRQVQFVVAGSGPEEAGIRLAAHGLGLDGGRVRFLGFVDDVPALLAGCDLLVHPSMADALPTALIHGLAAGLPIVASDVGGIPEIVTDGVGILVPPGNADALGRAVADLGSNADQRRWMGKRARERFDAEFDGARWARRLAELYRTVRLEAR